MCTKNAASSCPKTGELELQETAVSERCPESLSGPPDILRKGKER